jgi:hypothetical protein
LGCIQFCPVCFCSFCFASLWLTVVVVVVVGKSRDLHQPRCTVLPLFDGAQLWSLVVSLVLFVLLHALLLFSPCVPLLPFCIVIVITNQDSTSSRLLPGSSYSCCIRNLNALVHKQCHAIHMLLVFCLVFLVYVVSMLIRSFGFAFCPVACTKCFYAPVGHYKWFSLHVTSSLSTRPWFRVALVTSCIGYSCLQVTTVVALCACNDLFLM